MRKWILWAAMAIMAVSLTACEAKQEEEPQKEQQTTEENEKKEEEKKEEPEEKEPEKDIEQENSKTDNPVDNTVEAVVYYADTEGIVQNEKVVVQKLDEMVLWQLLKEKGTVAIESQVMSMQIDEQNQIHLDVNQAFGNQLRSLGTSGETILMQCVINSFLDNFSGEKIMITEEGNVLESNHASYDSYYGKQN